MNALGEPITNTTYILIDPARARIPWESKTVPPDPPLRAGPGAPSVVPAREPRLPVHALQRGVAAWGCSTAL